MTFSDRLQIAWHSEVGVLFIALLLILLLLGVAYLVLVHFQKKRDFLAYQHRAYFEKAESTLTQADFTFSSPHKAGFFGRETIGSFSSGTYGMCRILAPEEIVSDRFRCFHRAIANHKMEGFAPYLWTCEEEALIVIQGRLIHPDGRLLINPREYFADASLGNAEIEEILLDICRALATLHTITTEDGRRLYHGFLLPCSLYLDFDAQHKIRRITIADLGMAYAFGPQALHQRLEKLRENALTIEKFCASDLLEQLPSLAPEQKDPDRLDQVSPAADFYSFGAFATTLFTRQRFSSTNRVDWEMVPMKWHHFLMSCLSDNPKDRPKDFLEIIDWLFDPQLALTRHEKPLSPLSSSTADEEALTTLADLEGLLKKMQKHREPLLTTCPEDRDLTKSITKGQRALKSLRWGHAKSHFEQAVCLDGENAEAHLGLAIAHYELGDINAAESHSRKATEKNPTMEKRFRDHLAFKM